MKPYDVTKIFVDPHSTSVSLVRLEVGPTYYDCPSSPATQLIEEIPMSIGKVHSNTLTHKFNI